MKKSLLLMPLLASLLGAGCFKATDDLTVNAQQIRLISDSLGWKVGKLKSLSIAGLIRTKQEIFPDGSIKVCIQERDGDLKFIMYSSSIEESDPQWHFLTASKTGWF
ncbi:hypothetical protein ACM66Z_07145 [Sulfurovum sp. ST-21]|uniref:Lipoprotein n=1 Tax=Sulfurovum indicum TaxID=2779528 RepID=A0A7M1S1G4_9BACT|nr:hypothetical protein [Sulfurovum indicum]QOR61228.1 hypothetical protein IMZ28_07140 [Sulfurovum indicum]